MMRRVLRREGGFTYLAVLMLVVVTGILASRGALVWKTVVQREKEAELITRGTQIRDAMRMWYRVKVVPGKGVEPIDRKAPVPPNLPELKSLLKDPNVAGNKRYLRTYALVDPMTGEEWEVIRDTAQKIVGVRSKSEKEPIKKGNFPADLHPADFEGKQKYSEWEFRYDRVPPLENDGGVTGLPPAQQ